MAVSFNRNLKLVLVLVLAGCTKAERLSNASCSPSIVYLSIDRWNVEIKNVAETKCEFLSLFTATTGATVNTRFTAETPLQLEASLLAAGVPMDSRFSENRAALYGDRPIDLLGKTDPEELYPAGRVSLNVTASDGGVYTLRRGYWNARADDPDTRHRVTVTVAGELAHLTDAVRVYASFAILGDELRLPETAGVGLCADDGASCGSTAVVNAAKAACADGAMNACYCAAMAITRCYYDRGCYREAGAPTETSLSALRDLCRMNRESYESLQSGVPGVEGGPPPFTCTVSCP